KLVVPAAQQDLASSVCWIQMPSISLVPSGRVDTGLDHGWREHGVDRFGKGLHRDQNVTNAAVHQLVHDGIGIATNGSLLRRATTKIGMANLVSIVHGH